MVFVCFTETDRIQHYSLNLEDWENYVAPIYEEISDFITYLHKRITRLHEDAAIMIVSDHGAQKIHHKFLSNSWLIQKGYGVLKEEVYRKNMEKPKGKLSSIKSKLVDKMVESKFRRQIYSKMPRYLQKVGEGFVEESFDYETRGKYIRIKESDFDMEKTRAFCSVSFGPVGMLWINDERFSMPCVKKNEKKMLKIELVSKIKRIRDLEGKLLVKNVYEGYDYFSSSSDSVPPDIVFELEDGYTGDYSGYSQKLVYTEPEINRRGEHTMMGIFGIKSYNSIKTKFKAMNADLSKVSPTILKYFGVDLNSRSLI